MVYLGKEAHLGWRHWVLLGKEQFELEDSIYMGMSWVNEWITKKGKTHSGMGSRPDLG